MSGHNIQLTTDAVVFGYDGSDGLFILLVKRKLEPFKGRWALPGGFVKESETLEEAVERELKEETGISVDYLEQLYTFGLPERDPRGRVVSIAYYGMVRKSDFQLQASSDADDAQWFPWGELPNLSFDHKEIIEIAINRLKSKVQYEPVGFNLLDEKFTLTELRELYETILDEKLDRRNFNKKILQLGILVDLNEQIIKGKGRPTTRYIFDKKKYRESKDKGINFSI